MTDPTTLIDLFSPPPDHIGDFCLICGFTAGRETIERIKRRFSPDVAHPKLALLIHPTSAPVTDIPGVIWCHVGLDPVTRGFGLLHAKVALMAFRHRETGDCRLRLVVSTGNWTHEPLSTSIDGFWTCEIGPEGGSPDDAADLRRAWDLFQYLRRVADCGPLSQIFDGHLPDAAMLAAVDALPPVAEGAGRLIDNREQGLLAGIVAGLSPRPRERASTLVMGAGYYQGGAGTDFVPGRVRQGLIDAKLLDPHCRAALIANPDACQSLVDRAEALARDGWSAYAPQFPARRRGEPASPRKLHAKFVLLGTAGSATGAASLYLGSGNLTEPGLMDRMSPAGNLEAGVLIRTDLDWQGSARKTGLDDLLPIGRALDGSAALDLSAAAPGPDFERPDEPEALPQVTWLRWSDGTLSAPERTAQVRVRRPGGAVAVTPCGWPAPCPHVVTLEDSGVAVPVLSDGVLAGRPRPRSFDEILLGLRQFPDPSETDEESDEAPDPDPDSGGPGPHTSGNGPALGADTPDRPYPIRRMMRLLVALTGRQRTVLAYDWDRWCRELGSDLSGIAAAEEPTIAFFRMSGVDPLPILLDPRFLPDGADADRLAAALHTIRTAWDLSGCPSLWDEEDAA